MPDNNDALLEAVKVGDLVLVQNLITQGADINAIDSTGQTPAWRAASLSRWEIVNYLLEQGADITKTPHSGRHKNVTLLQVAAEAGKLDLVKKLVEEKGADINAADSNGATPVYMAAYLDKWEVVKYLLDQGADITKATLRKKTLLHLAARAVNLNLVEELVLKGADINAADADGQTALMYAVKSNNIPIANLLLLKNAKLDREDESWITTLEQTVPDNECVKYIREIYERIWTHPVCKE